MEYAYIGIKSCGCVVSAAVDMPAYKKETAKFVAAEIKFGHTIERVTVDEARERLSSCKCEAVHDGLEE